MINVSNVLGSLAFDEIQGRFNAVTGSCFKIFEWIFEDNQKEHGQNDDDHDDDSDHKGGEPEEEKQEQDIFRLQARVAFNSWLSIGHCIFHISGKLGSGKSILMEFLFQRHCTKDRLKNGPGIVSLSWLAFISGIPGPSYKSQWKDYFASSFMGVWRQPHSLYQMYLQGLGDRSKHDHGTYRWRLTCSWANSV